jgi:spore coat protein U-like protein
MNSYLGRPGAANGTFRFATLTLLALLTPLATPPVYAAVVGCTVSATSVAFGTYVPLQPGALIGTGTMTMICAVNSHKNTLTVDLSPGVSGSFITRTMTTIVGTTTYPLNYNLYQDAASTVIWGDGTGASQANTVTITRHANNNTITINLTVYGAVAPAQDPAPGSYTDGITVTVNF